MPRTLNTLIGRLGILQLLIFAVLLPALYYQLGRMVQANALSMFTRHARAYTASLARQVELGDILGSTVRTVVFLDGGVEGGGCVYAALEFNGRLFGSSVAETPAWVQRRGDDGDFSKSSDSIYAVSMAVHREGGGGRLYLGFDKRATLAEVRAARIEIAEALVAFGVASVIAAVLLARLVALPLTQLRTASRKIAQGDTTTHLRANSKMVEIVDLANDLDLMRSELLGVAEKLRAEMRQRQIDLAERATLEGQLRHEQRLATIGTFAGGLAHEFNNILVPLILYAEESMDQIGPEHPVRENLDCIVQAATRAANVISKLLAFVHPIAERTPEPVDVALVTNEALDLYQALMPSNIELIREFDGQVNLVLADATLLSQVVLNLCSNAAHAMRDGGGTLLVAVAMRVGTPTDTSGHTTAPVVELRVKDSGCGMSPATQERIFEPFFTMRDVGEGSGLGLSIVHGIVASMGGRISVVSALGAGAEFTVELAALGSTATLTDT